ncbi:MAG: AlpA family transcriptional regulator [Rhodospirillales bacterium]|nr:AlpA family transcriptional regulator [Rhodospirillales bacterium]
MRLLTLAEVIHRCGLKKSAIYKRVNEGSFPKPVKLSPKAVRWRSDEIDRWISDVCATRAAA